MNQTTCHASHVRSDIEYIYNLRLKGNSFNKIAKEMEMSIGQIKNLCEKGERMGYNNHPLRTSVDNIERLPEKGAPATTDKSSTGGHDTINLGNLKAEIPIVSVIS